MPPVAHRGPVLEALVHIAGIWSESKLFNSKGLPLQTERCSQVGTICASGGAMPRNLHSLCCLCWLPYSMSFDTISQPGTPGLWGWNGMPGLNRYPRGP